MDPSPFLQVLRRRWWLVLVGLVPTLMITLVRSGGEPPVYESTSTFVVRPVQADAERVMRAMDTLLRGVEINTTYANIVGSRHVSDRALERLDVSEEERAGLSARGKVITGTSILEIRVEAGSPKLARGYAVAVAEETLAYINGLENGFGLVPLDRPTTPRSAAGPGMLLKLAVSGVLGTVLGLGLAFASGQLLPLGGRRRFNIVDPVTGAYTEAYFQQRLREEVARIDRSGGALTVALLAPLAPPHGAGQILLRLLGEPAMARTAELLQGELRDGDILAYLGRGRFAILAPDRIAPELDAQLRTAQPALAIRVSESTYVGGQEGGEVALDDLPSFLRRLEDDLAGASPPVEHGGREPKRMMWSGRP